MTVYWVSGLIFLIILIVGIKPLRLQTISRLMLFLTRKMGMAPKISATEMAAIQSGKTGIEKYFFRPSLDISQLQDYKEPKLSEEEEAFLNGPVEELCRMVNDWEVWTKGELPEQVWDFLREKKFFGIIIPKEHGGLGFSRLAHSEIILKLSSRSIPLGITTMVPNSLGPAELLLEYGTDEQKKKYLPNLADGKEIPCFALTEPEAGSDASSLSSEGYIFEEDGKKKIRLSWEKRWITLGSVSTLMGVAFKLRDPDNLLGENQEDLGITCALIPSESEGISKECRHDPLGVPFVNSRISGKDVVIPIDAVIGGRKGIGNGWLMLTQCLAAGRGISLPAQTTGGAKLALAVTTAHSSIRYQFGLPISRFEGVREPLSRIAGLAFIMEATRKMSISAMDKSGVLPVISSIVKYNFTELNRVAINDAMDVLGGSGITRGPHNQLAHAYIASPIGITVEGANILTRSLMIFGQGAIRSHPYAFKLMQAIREKHLENFDKNLFGWCKDTVASIFNSLGYYFTRGRLAFFRKHSTSNSLVRKSYFRLAWSSICFYCLTNIAMFSLGGALKKKEHVTGRFADMLSWLFINWSVIRYYDQHSNQKGLDSLAKWSLEYGFQKIQLSMEKITSEFGGRFSNYLWRCLFLPFIRINPLSLGPRDRETELVCDAIEEENLRNFLTEGIYHPESSDPLSRLEEAYEDVHESQEVYQKLRNAAKKNEIPKSDDLLHSIKVAETKGIINMAQYQKTTAAEKKRREAIKVDAFCEEGSS